jgi:hypothetical protein
MSVLVIARLRSDSFRNLVIRVIPGSWVLLSCLLKLALIENWPIRVNECNSDFSPTRKKMRKATRKFSCATTVLRLHSSKDADHDQRVRTCVKQR